MGEASWGSEGRWGPWLRSGGCWVCPGASEAGLRRARVQRVLRLVPGRMIAAASCWQQRGEEGSGWSPCASAARAPAPLDGRRGREV